MFTTRLTRYAGSAPAPLVFPARHRYLRVTIENGDDAPLAGLRIEPRARSRAILVAEAREGLRVYYGDPDLRAPEYDFARLPPDALPRAAEANVELGPERPNPDREPPRDTRSFVERNEWAFQAALVFAALVVGAAAVLALRRRA